MLELNNNQSSGNIQELISLQFILIENENSIIIIIIEHSSSYLNLWDFGVFHWSDGSKYTGDWQNNKWWEQVNSLGTMESDTLENLLTIRGMASDSCANEYSFLWL